MKLKAHAFIYFPNLFGMFDMKNEQLPSTSKVRFICPSCNCFAGQSWLLAAAASLETNLTPDEIRNVETIHGLISRKTRLDYDDQAIRFEKETTQRSRMIEDCYFSCCASCGEGSFWVGDRLVLPRASIAPSCDENTPIEIRGDYREAAEILSISPRGAAALLRLCIQKLCKHLGQPGNNLNQDIGELVKLGLPGSVQKAFDVVRVIGNESVHPGQIDLNDDHDTALSLFHLVNLIVDRLIGEPARIEELFENLPDDKKSQIKRRDSTT